MDIIVRYMAIEEYYGKNDYGFNLYEKMQKSRGQKMHNLDRFKKLIKSIEQNGFNDKSSILVDLNLQIIDGSHRLACALYFGIEKLPIIIQPQITNIPYSIDWFSSSGFEIHEIEAIEKKHKDLIQEKGIYFVAILWPPVQDYFDEITEELKEHYKLLFVSDYSFVDNNEFNIFVNELYAIDDIQNWKIQTKLEYMKNYKKTIRVIMFDIGDPKFRTKSVNNKPISTKIEKIKKKYREKYSSKVDNYFYDIIMHIGDNYDHSSYMLNIIENYKNYRIESYCRNLTNKFNIKHLNELEKIMKKYNLQKSDFCIVGSTIMELSKIRKSNDMDIAIIDAKRSEITNSYVAHKISDNIEIVSKGWAECLGIQDEELITNPKYHFKINGFRFVKLELLYLKKLCMRREKDIKDIELINKCIKNGLEIDYSIIQEILLKQKNNNI